MRWANTTYEKVEVVDNSGSDVVRLQNCATGQYLTAAGGSSQPVTMSASGAAQNTHWTLVESGAYHNIDSESVTGGTGILRAPGVNAATGAYVIVSTLKAPPATDTDKTWTIHYDENNDTYRFESRTAGRFLYDNPDGTVTHTTVPATDNRSVWKAVSINTILPLDFISFKAQNKNTGTQLNWEIANEVNNNYFEILKSNGINEFQSIGRVENETGQKHYQFLDYELANQTSYYKIKQVDFDGRFSFSQIISVKSNADFEPLTLYPNPVRQNEDFTIESQQGYQIFDSKGMLLKSGTEKTIKMDLEKGIYFLKQNHSSQVEKFIVY